MTAKTPQLRKKTARELAEKFGVSPRTIRSHIAAPRAWWTEHRRSLQRKAAQLRSTGMKWADVGMALGVSENAARALGKRGSGEWATSSQPLPGSDPNTPDMFGGPSGPSGPREPARTGPTVKAK